MIGVSGRSRVSRESRTVTRGACPWLVCHVIKHVSQLWRFEMVVAIFTSTYIVGLVELLGK